MIEQSGKTNQVRTLPAFSAFWPLFMLSLSLAFFLGWQVVQAVHQYMNSIRLADQQTYIAGQAADAESKLQSMMMDLIKLSKTDADAQELIAKYKITFNPPQQQGSRSVPEIPFEKGTKNGTSGGLAP